LQFRPMDCAGGGGSFSEDWMLCPWNFPNRTESRCPNFLPAKRTIVTRRLMIFSA